MYRVIVYNNQNDTAGEIMHEPSGYGNKIVSGKVNTSFNAVNTAEFVISYKNSLYGKLQPIVNLIKVWDTETGKTVFDGRISKIESDFNGKHTETISAEDCLAYLHDSVQKYMAIDMNNNTIGKLFETVIAEHNAQVERHKQFLIGQVDFKYGGGRAVRYIDYKDTFETLKTRFVDMFGGYFTWFRNHEGRLVINYLSSTGTKHDSPIRLGVNMKQAKRTLDVTGVATRLFPIGDNIDLPDDQQGTTDENNRDPDETHERYTIESANNGVRYIDDEQLKGQFGILGRVEEYQTKDANVLLTNGWNYFHNQRIALLTWDLTVVNFNLLNGEFDPFILGDYYPVDDKLLTNIEYLQIIEKEINVVQPAEITIKIGNKDPNLSDYQQNLQSQVQNVKDASRNSTSSINTLQNSVGTVSANAQKATEIAQQASKDTSDNTIMVNSQATLISNLNTNMASVQERLDALENSSGDGSESTKDN